MNKQAKETLWAWAVWMIMMTVIGIATGYWEPFIGSFLGIIFLITGDFDDET